MKNNRTSRRASHVSHDLPERTPLALRRLLAAGIAACGIALSAAAPVHAASLDSLVKAVKFDDVKAVGKDLSAGADPNAVDDQGNPLLVLAAREKADKVAALLVANPKTNLEAQDRAGENAMMLAALNGDVDLVKLLISKDAEVNKKGWAPLHYAATNGNDEVVKLLLDNSAYVDAGSPNGTTPLMMAARGDHVSTAKLLLDNGADPSVKNQLGLTALDFAEHYHAPDVVKGLSARMQASSGSAAPQNGAK